MLGVILYGAGGLCVLMVAILLLGGLLGIRDQRRRERTL